MKEGLRVYGKDYRIFIRDRKSFDDVGGRRWGDLYWKNWEGFEGLWGDRKVREKGDEES